MRRIDKSSYKIKASLSYNPEDVNIRLQYFRVSELIAMIDEKSFDILNEEYELLKPNEVNSDKATLSQAMLFEEDNYLDISGDDGLQRNNGLWDEYQKSQFIESLMINLPIPVFYFDGSRKPWRIIDGLQRLYTIRGFVNGEFELKGLEYLTKECDRLKFKTLPGYLRKRILDAEIIAYVINPGTPPDVKYNIFKRINTGGLKLNGQEIRNSFFRGIPADFTKELASLPEFEKATNGKVPIRRMVDREYANRFIAFQVFDYKDYNSKWDLFLSEAMMDLYHREKEELEYLREAFKKSLERAYLLFEEKAFYRPKPDDNWGRSPNKALFDTLTWNMNELSEKQFSLLLENKTRLIKKYKIFMTQDDLMFKAINDTTSSKSAVINRFNKLNEFLKDIINA